MEILPLCFQYWTIGGFWRPTHYCSPLSMFLYSAYSLLAILALYSITFLELLDIIINFGTLDDFADNAFVLLSMMSDCYKAANTLQKRARIIEIQDMLSEEICRGQDEEEKIILEKFAKTCRLNTKNLGKLMMGCMIFMILVPMFYDVNDRVLPMKVWLPYSLSSFTLFYLSYACQSLALIFAVFVSVANDTYIAGLMIHTCAQLDILKYRLLNLPESRNVKMCIRHHNHILKLAVTTKQTFSSVVFFQCLVSATVVCITTFTLSKREVLSLEFVSTILYFPALIFQLLVYCWYGNEVTLKSVEVSDAVFQMDWVSLPVSIKKDLILIMVRADRAIKFTSGYVLTLSLDSYVAILKTSYSVFNVLQRSS